MYIPNFLKPHHYPFTGKKLPDKQTKTKCIKNKDHGKTKYDRFIQTKQDGTVDVYSVLLAFDVTCPARQHAIKKLLCSGIRGKGDTLQDLKETKVAVERAIEIESSDLVYEKTKLSEKDNTPFVYRGEGINPTHL